jgi:hypothetical protein
MAGKQDGYTAGEVAGLEAGILALVPDPLPLRSGPVPAEVTRVEGCSCVGLEWHEVGCSLWSLPCEDQMAAIDAARGREAAYTAALNDKLRALS